MFFSHFQLGPLYVDFTWGAGGTTSDLTMDLCVKAQETYGYVANMHLTCTRNLLIVVFLVHLI